MSSRSANTLRQTRERIIILLVALSVPLIVQFFIYVLASTAGATSLPVVGYGIAACSTAACTANDVSALWRRTRHLPLRGARTARVTCPVRTRRIAYICLGGCLLSFSS